MNDKTKWFSGHYQNTIYSKPSSENLSKKGISLNNMTEYMYSAFLYFNSLNGIFSDKMNTNKWDVNQPYLSCSHNSIVLYYLCFIIFANNIFCN